MAENDDSWGKRSCFAKATQDKSCSAKATRDKPGFASRCLLKAAGFLFSCLLISSILLTFSVENLESLLLNLLAEKNSSRS